MAGYSLPDLRLIAIRTWLLCQKHYVPDNRVREMPPLAEIEKLVAEIDEARAKAGQE